MRGLIILLIALALLLHQLPRPQEPIVREKWIDDLIVELKQDLPIRAGMTVNQIKTLIAENNQKEKEAKPEPGLFPLPAFSNPERHLYVFVDMNNTRPPPPKNLLLYWVNGRTQFWVEMGIEGEKIKNIYITPGNGSVIFPHAFLFDGRGPRHGSFPSL